MALKYAEVLDYKKSLMIDHLAEGKSLSSFIFPYEQELSLLKHKHMMKAFRKVDKALTRGIVIPLRDSIQGRYDNRMIYVTKGMATRVRESVLVKPKHVEYAYAPQPYQDVRERLGLDMKDVPKNNFMRSITVRPIKGKGKVC